jgi:hypothetical protein
VGRVEFVTSYSDTSGSTIVNQIKYEYDAWGSVYREFQADDHLWTVLRYVERNPLRAKKVKEADAWRWSSLWH